VLGRWGDVEVAVLVQVTRFIGGESLVATGGDLGQLQRVEVVRCSGKVVRCTPKEGEDNDCGFDSGDVGASLIMGWTKR
jgi:hypothetical protein